MAAGLLPTGDTRRKIKKEKPNEVHQKCLTSGLLMLHFWFNNPTTANDERLKVSRRSQRKGGDCGPVPSFGSLCARLFASRDGETLSKRIAYIILKGNEWSCSYGPFYTSLMFQYWLVLTPECVLFLGGSPLKQPRQNIYSKFPHSSA